MMNSKFAIERAAGFADLLLNDTSLGDTERIE